MKKKLLSFILGTLIASSGFAQNLVVNGDFSLPADATKHLFITEVDNWLSEETTENNIGREATGEAYMKNLGKPFYQPVGLIAANRAHYQIIFDANLVWNPNSATDPYMVTYFWVWPKGTSIADRVLIDSVATKIVYGWQKYAVSLDIPRGSQYVGDSLVIGFATRQEASDNTWSNIDNIAGEKTTDQDLMLSNGDFSLPADATKHLFITELDNWLSEEITENNIGREATGEAYMKNLGKPFYQPVDSITKTFAHYDVVFDANLVWNPNSATDPFMTTYFWAWPKGTAITDRVLIDSVATKIVYGWNTYTVGIDIPAASSYAGDSLIIGFATRQEASDNTWSNIDNISIGKIADQDLMLSNGDFSLPADATKHLFIIELDSWLSEETTENNIGREADGVAYMKNLGKPFYQPADSISTDFSHYRVIFDANLVWNPNSATDPYMTTYFWVWPKGTAITDRVLIDSVATKIVYGWNTYTVGIDIPAASSYAGDSLIIGFATRQEASDNTWTNIDNIVVSKITGFALESGPTWSSFSIAKIIDGKNLPSNFAPTMKLRWDNDSIYMIFDVNDTLVTTNTSKDIWNNDNIEVYLDMTNGKVAQWPRTSGWPPSYNNNGSRIPGNGYYQFRLVPDSSWATYNLDAAAATANLMYTKVQGGYQFVLNIPWDTLYTGFKPTIGKVIGFDVNVSDNNVNPDYRSQVDWNSPTGNIYADAALWGTLKFQPGGLFNQVLDDKVPTAPKNLKDTVIDSKVTLTWDASTDNIVVDKYIVTYGSEADTLGALKTGNKLTTVSLADGSYTFGVIAVDPSGNISVKATLKVNIGVDVKVANSAVLSFYPNPANNYINLKNTESSAVVKFFNITGQNVLTTTVQNGIIDVSSLKKGVYIIKLESEKTVFVSKMIKK